MNHDYIFQQVSKPARYIGGEQNSTRKRDAELTIALAFPDLYEIGMSHIGLKILYEIINKRDDALAERVFAPWDDYEAELRKANHPLVSLENQRPLKDFDILGFTLPYELTYTNILNMLDLADIPLKASERDCGFPLILGGGSSVFNPEPVAEFFDAFFLGDAEEAIHEILDCVKEFKREYPGSSGKGKKTALLEKLSRVRGIYIPSWFDVSYRKSGKIKEIKALREHKAERRIVADLDKAPFPEAPVVPFTKTVHDRISAEIARGCLTGCRFCQAGYVYRPLRERNPQTIYDFIDCSLNNTGYSEFSLASLNTGDYSCLTPLAKALNLRNRNKKISFSFPSLRSGTLNRELLDELKAIRKSGITIAPEAGSERLRQVINKEISEEKLLESISDAFKEGWRSLKLYFMIGLPTETMTDLDATVRLCREIQKVGRSAKPRAKGIKLSFSTFVPKAHTPFQWIGQIEPDEIKKRQKHLKGQLQDKIMQVTTHSAEMSRLEAVFSRGDRRLWEAIFHAWKLGSRFDAWSEKFNCDNWYKAFDACGIDPYFYANRTIDTNEILPWEHISTGIEKSFLADELAKSITGEKTPNCRDNPCYNCGVCGKKDEENIKNIIASNRIRPVINLGNVQDDKPPEQRPAGYLLSYKKKGNLKFLSHLDIIQILTRALRIAKVPILFTRGFNPHFKLSFGPPLPLGMESEHEVLKFEATGLINTGFFLDEINRNLPEMLPAFDLSPWPKPISCIKSISYQFFLEKTDIKKTRLAENQIMVTKKNGKQVDIKPFIREIREKPFQNGTIFTIIVNNVNGNTFSITSITDAIFGDDAPSHTDIVREKIDLGHVNK